MSTEKDLGYDVYSAMQEGQPYRSYKKAIIGKVLVRVLNPFSGGVEEILLYGNPYNSRDEETCVVDVWDVKGDQFFKKTNNKHLKNGLIVEFQRKEEKVEPSEEQKYNYLSDEDIEHILRQPFFTMTHALPKITQEATVIRFLSIAKKIGKSDNWVAVIEERLSEIQREEYEA